MPRSACQSDEVVGSLECASVCFLSPPSEQKRFYSKRGIGRIVGRVRGVGRVQGVTALTPKLVWPRVQVLKLTLELQAQLPCMAC